MTPPSPAPARRRLVAAILAALAATYGTPRVASGQSGSPALTLPIHCNLGTDCFVQQMPDIDPGPAATDPLCGDATYDGHEGWDFRVRTMVDVARGVPVIAVADGIVLRVRDGLPDRIVVAPGEVAEPWQGQECGNGVVVAHSGGLTSQYCHLRMGSVVVRPGVQVMRGAQLGLVGSSGLAQFPHVHLGLRRNGRDVEPLTGRDLSDAAVCRQLKAELFAEPVRQLLERPADAILDAGLSDEPPTLPGLVAGAKPTATAGGEGTLAWVWAINLQKGDRFQVKIVHPDGSTLVDQLTEPLPRRKANYLAYAGRRRPLVAGTYSVEIDLLRANASAASVQMSVDVDG
ncbi:M23 family metallopeptidase [Aurantimonas sp. HBX-1]|uniref:M23 family metallopeptidase n=1 Tax=Aurantimonas sp. HBX-1 TaxID=2906072 RepID=UPI001F474F52|nr:M23 family metallopeptidase [Aurantimonas sp. HBX-1]UIJ73903.1 M23 family metallopeptidase [Aurantimonas sp. HBX-1]